MRVLLDENLSPRFRAELRGHVVVTVRYAGWAGLTNGDLLRVAEDAGCEVFLTGDKNLSYQQNLEDRRIGIVDLTAHSWGRDRGTFAADSSGGGCCRAGILSDRGVR